MNNRVSLLRIVSTAVLLLPTAAISADQNEPIMQLSEIRIRDPFILADSTFAGTKCYYMYAQMGNRLRPKAAQKGVEVFTSKDLQTWQGPFDVFVVQQGFWADKMVWAPEVHRYKGRYYLFVTFTASDTLPGDPQGRTLDKRGTQILVSDSPKGPFKPFHNRAHTPADWMALDGTLWVEDGVPYMVFCHEWVQTRDGTMEIVRLKDDLSDANGSPDTLFLASEAPWVRNTKDIGGRDDGYVTDGPFLYRTSRGSLLMIWSSFGVNHYAVGIAVSTNGKITGPWKQIDKPLFDANGGHGMIFRMFDDRLMLILHQPNSSPNEQAHLFELQDTGDMLELKPKQAD